VPVLLEDAAPPDSSLQRSFQARNGRKNGAPGSTRLPVRIAKLAAGFGRSGALPSVCQAALAATFAASDCSNAAGSGARMPRQIIATATRPRLKVTMSIATGIVVL
jgi:hypothetical protein